MMLSTVQKGKEYCIGNVSIAYQSLKIPTIGNLNAQSL